MAVYKDNATGTWRVIYRFTNWKGERKQTQKRGFATKREALAWEHEVMLKQGAKLDMMLSRKLNDALSSRLFYAHFDSHRDISHFKSSCFCELFF